MEHTGVMRKLANTKAFWWTILGLAAVLVVAQAVLLLIGVPAPLAPIVSIISMLFLIAACLVNLRRIDKESA